MISAMYSGISGDNRKLFHGVKIYTTANRASIMSMDQYYACCYTFGLHPAIKKGSRRIRGIGGFKYANGNAMIQNPFPNLGLVIYVDFLLVSVSTPSLLCMKDMLISGL